MEWYEIAMPAKGGLHNDIIFPVIAREWNDRYAKQCDWKKHHNLIPSCHCERSEAISKELRGMRLPRTLRVLAMTEGCHCEGVERPKQSLC